MRRENNGKRVSEEQVQALKRTAGHTAHEWTNDYS